MPKTRSPKLTADQPVVFVGAMTKTFFQSVAVVDGDTELSLVEVIDGLSLMTRALPEVGTVDELNEQFGFAPISATVH